MSDSNEPPKSADNYRRLAAYREFLLERDEILRHKWYASEKAGRDIGFDRALIEWVVHHRSAWLVERRRLREMERPPED